MIDCLVIGGGPAGLLAATYLGRYRRRTCVIDAGDSRAALIPASHNYPGFAGIEGKQLLHRLRDQAQRYGVDVGTDRVTKLRKEGDAFTATCASRGEVQSAFVVLATGLVDRCPPIHGQTNLRNCTAVRFCPICDAFEATDGRIGVIGDLQSGGKKALFLRTYSKDVTLFLIGDGPRDAPSLARLAEAGVAVAGKFGELHATARDTVIV
jgi:thioredoxin reductase (NADPH)